MSQVETSKEVVKSGNEQNDLKSIVRIPTSKNMDMYQLYISGYKLREIAELYDISIQAVTAHLNRVSAYYDKDWRILQLNKVKAKANKVLQAFDNLVQRDDSRTVNNYLDKNVYPNKQVIETHNLNANIDLTMKQEDSDSMYDDDVEIVDAESEVEDDSE